MTISCKQCELEPKIAVWCSVCSATFCTSCLKNHTSLHQQSFKFYCQECQEQPSECLTTFCDQCEQHLCETCDEKIHNKGKRAKHIRDRTDCMTLKTKLMYVVCSDAKPYYGYISCSVLMMDLACLTPANQPYVIVMQKTKELNSLKKQVNVPFKTFNTDNDFDEELVHSILLHYPLVQQIVLVESPATKKFLQIVKSKIEIKMRLLQLGEVIAVKPLQKIETLSISSVSFNSSINNKSNISNISAKYPNQEYRNHHSNNMSTSTENSLRKRRKKAPISYYHPFICQKGDKRSEIQDKYREMAAMGVLMIRKDQCNDFEERVLRKFFRNIGETEVQYVSLQVEIQNMSVECLYWVIRSIEQDRMAPTEKLILSRLKESFDIKIQSKLWHYIIKYLLSNQYQNDRKQIDGMGNIPRLMVQPFTNQDNYILYCQTDDVSHVRWVYDDLGKLDQSELAWRQFLKLINNYFLNNVQIGGGRYGCVQYIRFNAPQPLRQCSLGKLSMFVQEAINKGIIRYHKTLLVSNKGNEEKQKPINQQSLTLPQLQTSVKIQTLQLRLIDIFMSSGPGVSIPLAQIPQNLRKNALIQINYVDLGFPKLKNLLATLTDLIQIEISKSHIMYSLRPNTSTLLQERRQKIRADTNLLLNQIMKKLLQIIQQSNLPGVAMEELYNQLSVKTGLILDCTLFDSPDFYRFLSYYGQNYFSIQINTGYFIVYKKCLEHVKKSKETSTPTFKQALQKIDIKFKNLQNYNWQTCVLADLETNDNTNNYTNYEEKEYEENGSESFSDFQSIYNIIDDDKAESQPQTVIVKECSFKTAFNGLCISKVHPIQEIDDSASNDFEGINQLMEDPRTKNKGQHSRMYSNNAQHKTLHYRVYSNMSPN